MTVITNLKFNISGNYTGWKATCIGNNSSAAVSMLKQVINTNFSHFNVIVFLCFALKPQSAETISKQSALPTQSSFED
jgi:20S proteasome alpha/beta subunit